MGVFLFFLQPSPNCTDFASKILGEQKFFSSKHHVETVGDFWHAYDFYINHFVADFVTRKKVSLQRVYTT